MKNSAPNVMSRLRKLGMLSLGVWSLVFGVSSPLLAADQCVLCHTSVTPKIAHEYSKSVHTASEMSCADCHGGDKKAEEKATAHAPAAGFRGKPDPARIPELCAGCHADIQKMKFHRLDTNVYREYLSSRHGELFQQGDRRVPACTGCHGVHQILSKKDPLSPTNRKNVPDTCGRCHADADLMASYKKQNHQVRDFKEGTHGQILYGLRPGNADLVPTCFDCHGAHGAMPPETTSVPAVCGTCHFAEQRYLMKSEHYPTLKMTGKPHCATCHGNHRNTIPATGFTRENCVQCHAQGTHAYQVSSQLDTLIKTGGEVLARLEQVRGTKATPETRPLLDAEYAKARIQFSELRKLSHTLNADTMAEALKNLEGTVNSAMAYQDMMEHRQEESVKIVVVIILAAVLLLVGISIVTAVLILRLMRRLAHRKNHGETPHAKA